MLQSGDLDPQRGKQVLSLSWALQYLVPWDSCSPTPTRKMLPALCFIKTLRLTVIGEKWTQEGNVRNQAQQSLQSLPLHTAGGSGQCVGPPTGSLFSLGLSQSGQAEGLSYSLWGILARQANSLPHGSSWVRGLPQAGVAFPVQQ